MSDKQKVLRIWENWATVVELSALWEISIRRVQQIIKEHGEDVMKGYVTFKDPRFQTLVNTPIYRTVKPFFMIS